MSGNSVRTYRPPGPPVTSYFTRVHVVWYVSCLVIGITIIGLGSDLVKVIGVIATAAFTIGGVVPVNDRPLFLGIPRWIRDRWGVHKGSNIIKREFNSKDVVYGAGVTPLPGMFDISAAIVKVAMPNGRVVDVPLLRSAGRHTLLVLGDNNGETSLASPERRETIDGRRTQMYAEMTTTLGSDAGFAVWSITRPQPIHAGNQFLAVRGDKDVLSSDDRVSRNLREIAYTTHHEVTERAWMRRRGISVNAVDPRSWKDGRLHRLTPSQVQKSTAVQAALGLVQQMRSAMIDNGRLATGPVFGLSVRRFWSLGNDQDDYERRALLDRSDRFARAATPVGEPLPEEPLDFWTGNINLMPSMDKECNNDYLVFDGSYHRVMWAFDTVERDVEGGYYDPLHEMECSCFVALPSTVVLQSSDEFRRNERGTLHSMKPFKRRHRKLKDLDAEAREQDGKFAVYETGGEAVYFRLLIIASGATYEEMLESEQEVRKTCNDLHLGVNTITGSAQILWYWAALAVTVDG